MSNNELIIQENLFRVQERIARAAERVGRTASEIKLVGVTKYVTADVARILFDAGCRALGESRPQVLWEKAEALNDLPIEWHLVGHLQRNKVRRSIEIASLIHSVDSLRLLEAIEHAGAENNTQIPILLEVNVSGESAKHGFDKNSILQTLDFIARAKHARVKGLMCMAGLDSDDDQTRREFAELRKLRDQLAQQVPSKDEFTELSMGMSGDFELAIEEGATIVRIGSVLFEGLQ